MTETGDTVLVKKGTSEYKGILMPSQTDSTIIKLANGYNIGIQNPDEITLASKKEDTKSRAGPRKTTDRPVNSALPTISILSTGGTIASKVDYRTGAVTSQFTGDDIINAIPRLSEIANYNARVIYSILSENMKPSYWTELARAVYEEIQNGADGIIITHGTDTMTYTASALSFMLDTPVPIVFVGSQRSADRPSSDNVMNALCAAKVATSDIAEVTVVMHGTTSDDYCLINRATKVRKLHTSRRDAFESVNTTPIGQVEYPSLKITTGVESNAESNTNAESTYTRRGEKELVINDSYEDMCTIVKYTPGTSPDVLRYYIGAGYKGIVLEGTGLGHVGTDWVSAIKEATAAKIVVAITSQCIHGRICDRVYDTGRDMIAAGAIEAEDMMSEVALVKLMCLLGRGIPAKDVRNQMRTDMAGEITQSTPGSV